MTAPDPTALDTQSHVSRSEIFGEGAPDVAITGLDVLRATIVRRDFDADEDGDGLHWHIYGVPSGLENSPLTLVGDLALASGGWFVGATVTALIGFRDPGIFDPASTEQVREFGRTLGAWASHVLYDLAASRGRSLVASSSGCPLELPLLTPSAHFAYVRLEEGPLAQQDQPDEA